ncbi:hypothetical protein ACVWXM_009668 [Bradyrhizobium sp. GM7.3]
MKLEAPSTATKICTCLFTSEMIDHHRHAVAGDEQLVAGCVA